MGMSLHIVGFKPPNEKFIKMKNVYDACKAADLTVPEEVSLFFNDREPTEHGVEVEMQGLYGVDSYNDENREGFEVDLHKIPKDIQILRFYYSC